MSRGREKKLFIIAGPNGAGKTTFALDYLPQIGCTRFINADLIASGLSPLAPEREILAASRIFLRRIKECIAECETFAFETTYFSGAHLSKTDRAVACRWLVRGSDLSSATQRRDVKTAGGRTGRPWRT